MPLFVFLQGFLPSMPCPKSFWMNKPADHSIDLADHSTDIRLARASALVFQPPCKSTIGTEWVPADRATTVTCMKTEPQQCHCHRLWAHRSACRLHLPYTSSFRQVSKSPAAHQAPADQEHLELSVPVPEWAHGHSTSSALALQLCHGHLCSGTAQLQGWRTEGVEKHRPCSSPG